MTAAYATAEELVAFTGTAAPDGADRLLARASEVIDSKVTRPFAVSTVTGLPTDTTIAATMADACCAQVEFWAEVGEEHDLEGIAGTQASVGHMSLEMLPPELGPRARRILLNGAMVNGDDVNTTSGRFFATQSGA